MLMADDATAAVVGSAMGVVCEMKLSEFCLTSISTVVSCDQKHTAPPTEYIGFPFGKDPNGKTITKQISWLAQQAKASF